MDYFSLENISCSLFSSDITFEAVFFSVCAAFGNILHA